MENIIVYSGGYDSTLVIHELLNRYPGETFTIVGFNINLFSSHKNRAENLYREKYIDYLHNDAKTRNFKYVKIDSENFNNAYSPLKIGLNGGLAQQPYFVFMTSYFCPGTENNVFTGFHNGDCYFKYERDFYEIHNAVSNIMNKKITFHHLLRKADKYQVIERVRQLGLEEFCFTCEDPKGYFEACGECKPCTEVIMANKRIAHSRRKRIDVNAYMDFEYLDSILNKDIRKIPEIEPPDGESVNIDDIVPVKKKKLTKNRPKNKSVNKR